MNCIAQSCTGCEKYVRAREREGRERREREKRERERREESLYELIVCPSLLSMTISPASWCVRCQNIMPVVLLLSLFDHSNQPTTCGAQRVEDPVNQSFIYLLPLTIPSPLYCRPFCSQSDQIPQTKSTQAVLHRSLAQQTKSTNFVVIYFLYYSLVVKPDR